jgi:CheY-like chemotaxis protein
VEAVANGNEALHVVKSFTPDVIVMDLSMPELDGIQTSLRLKHDMELRDIPIVVLTAYPLMGCDAVRAGCDDFLFKPCAVSDLQETLLRAVRASEHRGR